MIHIFYYDRDEIPLPNRDDDFEVCGGISVFDAVDRFKEKQLKYHVNEEDF